MVSALGWLAKTVAATIVVLIVLGIAMTLGIVGALQLASVAQ